MEFNSVEKICQMAAAQKNHRWSACGTAYQDGIRKKLEWVTRAGIGERIERTVRNYLAEKYHLENVLIKSISLNGSTIQSECTLSKPSDVDSTVEIDHPFLLGALTEAPRLYLEDGTGFNDIGLLSTGLHGVSRHAKYIDGVYSHLTGGYPIYGAYFSREPLTLAEILAYAKRLNDCAGNELTQGNLRKSIHRFIDVQSLLVTVGIFPQYAQYQPLWSTVDRMITAGEEERKAIRLLMDKNIQEVQALIAGYVAANPKISLLYQAAFPDFPWYNDWIRCMKIIRNPLKTEAEELSVLQLGDWSIDLILAGVAKSDFVLKLLAERYAGEPLKKTYMENAIAFNLGRREHAD